MVCEHKRAHYLQRRSRAYLDRLQRSERVYRCLQEPRYGQLLYRDKHEENCIVDQRIYVDYSKLQRIRNQ